MYLHVIGGCQPPVLRQFTISLKCQLLQADLCKEGWYMIKITHVLAPMLLWSCVGGSPLLAKGARLPDRTAELQCSCRQLQEVAHLDLPPGNVAVSPEGRVFFTYLPQAKPTMKVA